MELKSILTAIEVLKSEDSRNNLVMGITLLVVLVIIIILIPIYILLNPFDSVKYFLSEDEQNIVKNIQTDYVYTDYGMGNITINSNNS